MTSSKVGGFAKHSTAKQAAFSINVNYNSLDDNARWNKDGLRKWEVERDQCNALLNARALIMLASTASGDCDRWQRNGLRKYRKDQHYTHGIHDKVFNENEKTREISKQTEHEGVRWDASGLRAWERERMNVSKDVYIPFSHQYEDAQVYNSSCTKRNRIHMNTRASLSTRVHEDEKSRWGENGLRRWETVYDANTMITPMVNDTDGCEESMRYDMKGVRTWNATKPKTANDAMNDPARCISTPAVDSESVRWDACGLRTWGREHILSNGQILEHSYA
eukprot:CFRG1416T1